MGLIVCRSTEYECARTLPTSLLRPNLISESISNDGDIFINMFPVRGTLHCSNSHVMPSALWAVCISSWTSDKLCSTLSYDSSNCERLAPRVHEPRLNAHTPRVADIKASSSPSLPDYYTPLLLCCACRTCRKQTDNLLHLKASRLWIDQPTNNAQ